MPAREGETEEEYRERKRRAHAEREARGGGGGGGGGGEQQETDEERHARHAREKEERRRRRAERDAAESGAAAATSGGGDQPAQEETEDERRARHDREKEERRRRRAERDAAAGNQSTADAVAAAPAASSTEETREERHARRRAEREAADQAAAAAAAAQQSSNQQEETEDERRARHDREKEERRRRRAERDAAAAAAGGGSSEQTATANPGESEEDRKQRERAERRARREAERQGGITADDAPASNNNNQDSSSSKPAGSPTADRAGGRRSKPEKTEAPVDSGAAGDDGMYGYEDDFEAEEEVKDVIDAVRLENERLRQAMEARNTALTSKTAAIVEAEGVARSGFDRRSLEEERAKAIFDRYFERARMLRRVVDIEGTKFPSVADIAPLSQYDMFVRGVGGVARSNVGEQMPERASVEIQAERVVTRTRGCSVPVDAGIDPEARDTLLKASGHGGKDHHDDDSHRSAMAALARRSVDTASLSKFLNRAGSAVLAYIDEENEVREKKAGRGAGDQASKSATLLAPFATLSTSFNAGFAAGRPVNRVVTSSSTSQYFLVVQGVAPKEGSPQRGQSAGADGGDSSTSVFPGLCTVWNVHAPQQPDKVLVAFSEIIDACFSRTRPYLVYGGTTSGSVCVWDLREPATAHGSRGSAASAFRLPSFTTDSMKGYNHGAPVQRVVSCGTGSGSGSAGGGDDIGSVEQVTSVDRTGCLSFWVLSESTQLAVDQAIAAGGAGTPGSPTAAGSSSTSGQSALEMLIVASMSTASCVRLHRMGTGNTLDITRGMKTSASLIKGAADAIVGDENEQQDENLFEKGKDSTGIIATVTDMEQSPIDATRLVVSAFTGVAHVSRFGSIAAPISYGPTRVVAGPSIENNAHVGTGHTAASTCVAQCRCDSRLLLVGYADGTIRLYLRVDTVPKLTVIAAEQHSIVSVCFAPNTRWIAFALDAVGNVFALDFATGKRNRAFDKARALRQGTDVATSLTTFQDERPETRLLVGFKSGAVEVHTFQDSVLAPANERDNYWL